MKAHSSICHMRVMAVLGVCLVLGIRGAEAWNPIAHYYITQDATQLKSPALPIAIADYANLPDYDGTDYRLNLPWLPDIPIGIAKTSWCWSHGVQTNGRVK